MPGVGSIFQSPVCSTVPSAVRITSAFDSGIECDIETSSTSNGPIAMTRLPTAHPDIDLGARTRLARRLASSSAAVNGVAIDRRPSAAATGRRAAPK
jgi:hypothetical protein